MRETKIEVGAWVRFYRDGELVLGVVQYVKKHGVLDEIELCTDVGVVLPEDVLEFR